MAQSTKNTLNLEQVNRKRNPYLAEYRQDTKKYVKKGRRKRKKLLFRCALTAILILMVCNISKICPDIFQTVQKTGGFLESLADSLAGEKIQGLRSMDFEKHPEWREDYLSISEYSRPGEPLKKINSIFVHYTANQGTSAAQNRSYFEQLKDTHERAASAHFIIGYEGEIIQCIPLDEIGYAVKTRNEDSISIECCYTSSDGSFTQATYDSLLSLLKWLTEVYHLDPGTDVLRHYDCGGKKCPIYYVEHEDAWEQLKADI